MNEDSKDWKKQGIIKTNIYMVMAILTIVVMIVVTIAVNLSYKEKALDAVENKYHAVDEVYAANFMRAIKHPDVSSNISFVEDDNCFIGVINKDGDIICYHSGKNSLISTSNVFKYLEVAKEIGSLSYEEAVSLVLGDEEGRFEFYGGNQLKMLIYTPIINEQYSVVRIVPKKFYIEERKHYESMTNNQTVVLCLGLFVVLAMVLLFREYAMKLEDSNNRHNMIAADSDIISFTYHQSIASFEMTGAVEKVFGADIARRGQIDWNTFSGMLHPDDQMLLRNISKAIKNGETKYSTEFRAINENGEFHWYRFNGKCVFDAVGDLKKFVGTIQNSDDQISHVHMLKNKAEHDLLTGLLNKITIQEVVDAALLNSEYSVFAFYIIDLDNFKAVNDKLGHAIGDKALVDVASKLQLIFNDSDYIGRLGGDEFAVLLVIPAVMSSQAEKLITEKARNLNKSLRAEYGDDDIRINVSASIGISIFPSDGNDFQTLYQHADRALYHSKENGKNQFTFYSEVE